MNSVIPKIVPRLSDTLKIVEGLPDKGIKPGRLGLMSLEGFRYYVYDAQRSQNFYLNNLGFKKVAQSIKDTDKKLGHATAVYGAGHARVEVASPIDDRSWAKKFLDIHPDGVSNLIFRVKDLDYAIAFLAERGACFIDHHPLEVEGDGGHHRSISIASPLGDVVFTFVERSMKYDNYAPGFERVGDLTPRTEFNYRFVDHITSNTRTMMPTIWFYKYILGMDEYWNIQFHTADTEPDEDVCLDWHKNSGLRSIVMWDPDSGIKFATNEPLAPNYYNSQISKYCDDNFGSGVQHVALAVPEITEVVEELYDRKVLFLDSPDEYYSQLPERMQLKKIFNLDKPIDRLKELGILLDGEENHYLLQIFMKDSATSHMDPKAGPFFYELIQRRGHQGFGEGNFRALFEAIEGEQSKGHDVNRDEVLDSAQN